MTTNNKLYELIFFITSKCNSRCAHCFNWKNLNKNDDLDIFQIESILKRLPEIENLLLSGGEPFLRDDLLEILKLFKKYNNIKTISIPTNGLLGDKIIDVAIKILEIKDIESVNINFSIDGLFEKHDEIRGVPNNFEKSLRTIKELSSFKKEYKNLNILINTVILKESCQEIFSLGEFIKNQKITDNHYFEIVRNHNLSDKDKIKLEFKIYEKILKLQFDYFKKKLLTKNVMKRMLRKIYFLGKHYLIYKIQYNNYCKGSQWPFKCSAGRNILVLQNNGQIQLCEPREQRISLFPDLNIERVIQSPEFINEKKDIEENKCFCTHVCFIDASINRSKYARLFLIPIYGLLNYFKYEYFSNNPNI